MYVAENGSAINKVSMTCCGSVFSSMVLCPAMACIIRRKACKVWVRPLQSMIRLAEMERLHLSSHCTVEHFMQRPILSLVGSTLALHEIHTFAEV